MSDKMFFPFVLVSDDGPAVWVRNNDTGQELEVKRDEIPMLIALLRIGNQKLSPLATVCLDPSS